MSYDGRPLNVDQVTIAVLQMIDAHQGKPCPTRREVMDWTGIPRRRIWRVIGDIQARGLVEVQTKYDDSRNVWRRMRTANGQWTGWTERRKPTRREAMMLEAAGGC